MARWRRQYDEFAGPRYPSLIAYAQLLVGSRNRADALVEYALRRTFSRLRRLGTAVEIEAEIRRLIVARFLATAGDGDPVVEPTSAAAGAVADQWRPPSVHADQGPSPYAPPAADATAGPTSAHPTSAHPRRTVLHTPVTDVADETHVAPHESHESHQSHLRAERSGGVVSESDQTHAALAMLSPQARAITVLRHYDGLAPGLIATQLGLDPDVVTAQLRASHATLRSQLGITILDDPDHVAAAAGDGAQQVLVTPHARSR